jgi:hypothetical protein
MRRSIELSARVGVNFILAAAGEPSDPERLDAARGKGETRRSARSNVARRLHQQSPLVRLASEPPSKLATAPALNTLLIVGSTAARFWPRAGPASSRRAFARSIGPICVAMISSTMCKGLISKFSPEPKELNGITSAVNRYGGNAIATAVKTGLLPHPLGDQQL